MQIAPAELTDNGFILLDQLNHKELIPFVQTYLRKRTIVSVLYTIFNLLLVVFILFWFYYQYKMKVVGMADAIRYFSYGIGVAFLLIPIHEYIHLVAYKSQGATSTSYDANWKKFYFLAVADQFVANRKEFYIVALAPFLVISAALLVLLVVASPLWAFAVLGTLLTHTAFTSGDFGLLSYFRYHKDKEIVTYDDKLQGMSYFYGRAGATNNNAELADVTAGQHDKQA